MLITYILIWKRIILLKLINIWLNFRPLTSSTFKEMFLFPQETPDISEAKKPTLKKQNKLEL